MRRYRSMPGLKGSANQFGARLVVRICGDTVVKPAQDYDSPPSEVLAMQFIRSTTTIPTPCVRRTIRSNGANYIVMEYVEGEQLAKCWHSLSLWSKLSV